MVSGLPAASALGPAINVIIKNVTATPEKTYKPSFPIRLTGLYFKAETNFIICGDK